MKVLVTGGSGFIGSHIVDALLLARHEVIIFDMKCSQHISDRSEAGTTFIEGSITDENAVNKAAKGCDVIYHFAAIADIEEAATQPVKTFQINVMGTLNMLEAARSNSISRFIFASSIYVYSNQGAFYKTSKRACEQLIEDYHSEFDINYTILRFGSLYGPRAGKTNAVYQMIKQALETKSITYKGTGNESREYIHASDGAAAAIEMLSSKFENKIIHLTGHERITTRDMMDMIAEILGSNISIEVNTGEMVGHYSQTPYSYTPKLGTKHIQSSYIDIGLGLLDLIQLQDQEINKQ